MPLAKETVQMSDLDCRKLGIENQRLDLGKNSVDPGKLATALN